MTKYLLLALAILNISNCYARTPPQKAVRDITEAVSSMQPHWETIPPKSKEECLKESGGSINNVYVRCRNGRQEYVRINANGERLVVQERAIPANMPY